METGLQKTLNLLKKYEGFRDTVYLDGKGIPTIGYGFTDPELIKKGKITRKEADSRLAKEIATRYKKLQDTLPGFDNLSDDSKAALISYHFNYPAGFKDTTKFMQYWKKKQYGKAINEIDAGMNDLLNPGLRTRRLEEQSLLRNDPYFNLGTSVIEYDGNKKMIFPRGFFEDKPKFQPQPLPEPAPKTIYPLSGSQAPQSLSSWNSPDAPNAGVRLKDFNERMNEITQDDAWDTFNKGAVATGRKKQVLPRISEMLDYGKEKYFADLLGVPSLYDQSNQPGYYFAPLKSFKNGKLPRFEDGHTSGGWVREKNGNPIKFNEETGNLVDLVTGETGHMEVPEITISPNLNDPYRDSRIREGLYADDSWHRHWLSLRQSQFEDNVNLNRKKFSKNGTDTIEKQLQNLSSSTEFSKNALLFYDQTGKRDLMYFHEGESGFVVPRTDGTKGNSIWYHKRYSGVPYDPLTEFDSLTHSMSQDELDAWNKKLEYELASPDDIKAARIRQRTNALNPWTDKSDKFGNALPQHEAIKKINKRHKIEGIDPNKAYQDLMETRFRLGLSPDHVVTREEIQQWKNDFKMAPLLNVMDDDALLEYFNEVASNPNPLFNPSNVIQAYGMLLGKLLHARDGKSPIHIKPENRGKLTKLKKRTGKSESELYNDGNPAHKKMVVFARNARKWKH